MFNFRLCRHNDAILSSTLAVSMPPFREKVIGIIHWLLSKSNKCEKKDYRNSWNSSFFSLNINLVLGAVEFFGIAAGLLIWLISIQRQAPRMNVLLFRSLLQRVSQLYFSIYRNILSQYLEPYIFFERLDKFIKRYDLFLRVSFRI